MILEEKLIILANCDFSSDAKWKRAGDLDSPPGSIYDFGNSIQGIRIALNNIIIGIQKDEAIENIYTAFGIISLDYASIPFDRMNSEDEDFRFLFEFRKRLEKLGNLLSCFINKCHRSKFNLENSCREYVELKQFIKEIQEMNYAEHVLRKYGLAD